MTEEEKQPWVDLASAKAHEHKLKYPNWSYKPRPKKAKRVGTHNKMVKTKGVTAKPKQQQSTPDHPMDMFNMNSQQNYNEHSSLRNQGAQETYVNPNEIHQQVIHHSAGIDFGSVFDNNGNGTSYGTIDNQQADYEQPVMGQITVAETFLQEDHPNQPILNHGGIGQLEASPLQYRQQEPSQPQVSPVATPQLQIDEELARHWEMEFLNLDESD
jgi:hypothetical protein